MEDGKAEQEEGHVRGQGGWGRELKMKDSESFHSVQRDFFREILLQIHRIMADTYELRNVGIEPMGRDGSRLSIPIKISGIDIHENEMKIFGKILGSSDIMTEKTIQFFKNIFLQMNSMEPLFDFDSSAEEMANHQYETLTNMYEIGIPTAKPIGCHPLKGNLWLFLAEFLDGAVSASKEVTLNRMETAFKHLRKMHRKKIFHGDIKPENILFSDRVYIMDVGKFLDDASTDSKRAYDLASILATFLDYAEPEEIVELAKKHYSKRDLRNAGNYIELVQNRPDFSFSDRKRKELMNLLS
jgi:tRNA A-37 threonylcarbamoyl transferase component Bud32